MKKLLVVALLSITGVAAWRWHGADAPHDSNDTKLLKDRLWVDHIPRNDRDTINVFAVLAEEPVGLFQTASMWRGSYEIFQHESSGEELRLVFPQTGDKERVRAHPQRCQVEGMDYCLEISGSSRGVKRYFSRKGWEIGGLDQAKALVESLEK